MHIAILYAGSISRVSGTAERILQIANGLADLGVQVTLSGAIGHRMKAPNLLNLRVIVMPNRILKFPSVCKWIANLVASSLIYKYDVVQIESFSFSRSLALFLLFRPFSRKFVIVFHDKWFKDDPRRSGIGRLQLFIQRILLTLFDASITPGLSVKKWFEELHGEFVHEKNGGNTEWGTQARH